ncbi:MAG: hypothetical protein IIA87_04390 [Nanoarchaeota archaeon]|nr:hypothetical protein [Nanoarchaeota archaeon]
MTETIKKRIDYLLSEIEELDRKRNLARHQGKKSTVKRRLDQRRPLRKELEGMCIVAESWLIETGNKEDYSTPRKLYDYLDNAIRKVTGMSWKEYKTRRDKEQTTT